MTNLEKMKMNVTGLFWTRRSEMVKDLENLDYSVCEINNEYIVATDDQDDEESGFILYLGHANSTMWVENIKEVTI